MGPQALASYPPDALVCPLSLEPFTDPVTLVTGITYEREIIKDWLKNNNTCPKTQRQLTPEEVNSVGGLGSNCVIKNMVAVCVTDEAEQRHQELMEAYTAQQRDHEQRLQAWQQNLDSYQRLFKNCSRQFEAPHRASPGLFRQCGVSLLAAASMDGGAAAAHPGMGGSSPR